MNNPVVGFVGMTHLGLVSATAVCAKGFKTLCFDLDKQLVKELQAGNLPVSEPGLEELIKTNGEQQCFTSAPEDLSRCELIYISTDVPTDDEGNSDLTEIEALVDTVITKLNENAILIIHCQVPPGYTRKILISHDRLYYQVETLIFGQAIERATEPERFIVGCHDPSQSLAKNYRILLESFGCPILLMRYESAELAKISINMYLVASVSVANTLAELCESIGADWYDIVPALKLDKRIGQHAYLNPGLGIAGGNLERDLATVIRFSEIYDLDAGIVKAFINNSRHRREWPIKIFNRLILPKIKNPKIAIWGLAYKENTHSIKNSPSLATIKELQNFKVMAHDPVVPVEKVNHLDIECVKNPLDAVKDIDVLMILTPWSDYKNINVQDILSKMRNTFILDPYSILKFDNCNNIVMNYFTLGSSKL